MKRLVLALSAAAALTLAVAACSSAPEHFYTLDTAAPAATAQTASAPYRIELTGVDVPEQVAKPQLVISRSATQVEPLEQERWASLPSDAIRHALSLSLERQLGTLDVSGVGAAPSVPVYRISVNVRRFESWPGQRAVLDATWSVHAMPNGPLMTCGTLAEEPVGAGYDALVAGHRRAVEQLAEAIAAEVRSLAAGGSGPQTSTCPT